MDELKKRIELKNEERSLKKQEFLTRLLLKAYNNIDLEKKSKNSVFINFSEEFPELTPKEVSEFIEELKSESYFTQYSFSFLDGKHDHYGISEYGIIELEKTIQEGESYKLSDEIIRFLMCIKINEMEQPDQHRISWETIADCMIQQKSKLSKDQIYYLGREIMGETCDLWKSGNSWELDFRQDDSRVNYLGEMIMGIDNSESFTSWLEDLERKMNKIEINELNMTKPEMKNRLKKLKNEKEFHNLLFDIIGELGFKEISYTHGSVEYGKDIICSTTNLFDIKEWNVFIAKIGDISLDDARETTEIIKNINKQISDANEVEYEEINTGSIRITRIFVITNGLINEHAKTRLLSQNKDIAGKIFFVDKLRLINLCRNE